MRRAKLWLVAAVCVLAGLAVVGVVVDLRGADGEAALYDAGQAPWLRSGGERRSPTLRRWRRWTRTTVTSRSGSTRLAIGPASRTWRQAAWTGR